MADTLSQEEVNALREAVQSGDISADERGAAEQIDQVKITTYDFRKPQIVSSEQLRRLEMVHETLAKLLEADFFSVLRRPVEFRLVAVDQISYKEFILSTQNPTYLLRVSTQPDCGPVAMELNLSIVMHMLDILLGGSGVSTADPREMTPLELHIFKEVNDVFIQQLSVVWSSLAETVFDVDSTHFNPEYLELTTPETPCMCVTLDIRIGEAITGVLNLCYPFSMIQALLTRGGVGLPAHQGDVDQARMLKAVGVVPLDIHAVLGRSRVSTEQMGKLKPGDVLRLDQRIDTPIQVYLGKNLAYTAQVGKSRGKVAVELAKSLGPVSPEQGQPQTKQASA